MIGRADGLARGTGVAAGLALLFTAYCQLHSTLAATDTSFAVSLRWGALAGVPAALLLLGLLEHRQQITALLRRGWLHAVGLFVTMTGGVSVGGAALHLLAAPGSHAPTDLLISGFQRLPLAAALAGLLVALLGRRSSAHGPAPAASADCWIMMPGTPQLVLRHDDILAIRSAGNYCEVCVADRTHLVRASMKAMADALGAAGFVRIHRTIIVNIAHVAALEPARRGGGLSVRMRSGFCHPVGDAYAGQLRESLST